MCERYSLTSSLSDIEAYYQLDKVAFPYKSSYLLEPTQPVPIIIAEGEVRRLEQYRWGLFPFWAPDSINAASETVADKRAFRKIFTSRRCVIPCDGYFGWKAERKVKLPVRFVLRHQKLFGFAGFYDVWLNPGGEEIRSCTILTTYSNRLAAGYHERMPVILDQQTSNRWLDARITDKDVLSSMLMPYDAEQMDVYPVTGERGSDGGSAETVREILPQFSMLKE